MKRKLWKETKRQVLEAERVADQDAKTWNEMNRLHQLAARVMPKAKVTSDFDRYLGRYATIEFVVMKPDGNDVDTAKLFLWAAECIGWTTDCADVPNIKGQKMWAQISKKRAKAKR